ncbi:MFS general substrate transporter [Penicillium macrosclerotiorum]|uniref:MFS general substrate transporter n=1 Tax=Penicillium macrosclerotiorum TaxID=303699 RepID=UPI0025491054|nr:MFS general substrate transporter [Penicillium macrosclerotiorum]KAJ5688865.1 MFS general substrate transporter [Penicillium macrosclerotiorum]
MWFKNSNDRPSAGENEIESARSTTLNPDAKEAEEAMTQHDARSLEDEVPTEDAQAGVQGIEAITLSWSRSSLIVVYLSMFSLYMVNAFRQSITGNLYAYITSDFSQHSLIPVISIVTGVMGAACNMPIAKMLNLWDRAHGFIFLMVLSIIGTILSATCKNIAVYCAGEVFSTVGFTGMIYAVDVLTADTSKVSHRGMAFAFTSSPYIVTAFAGPKAAEKFNDINWRWGYGCWAILVPFVAAPLYICMQLGKRDAKKKGIWVERKSGRTFYQSLIYYLIEFDVLGVVLLAGGLVVFLLPFSIATSVKDEWRSGSIIAMLVVGFVILIVFALVERFVAPKPFVPFRLLTSRTVVGACLIDLTYQIAYYCWNSYFTSYLQVVYGLSVSTAGYITGIFDIVSAFWLLGVGYLMYKTARFRWLLLIAVPMYILFVGLLIYFRRPGTNIGYIVMCEIFIALSGGTMILCQQVAVTSVSAHNDVAAILAVLSLFGNVGGAIGNSISGAVWTNTLPQSLKRLLPDSAKADWQTIYDDITVQLSYPMGSAVRTAIIDAYADTQTKMIIAGTAVMALSLIWMLLVRDIKLTDVKQVKGLLF